MSSASRAKRKRKAAVRSAKRSRNNTWWYGLTAIILIAGVALVVYARANVPADVGPFVADKSKPPTDNVNLNSHWHAALGVYDCDHWMGDTPGSGIWQWPGTTSAGIFRVDQGGGVTQVYAGLHSHNDGIIHMEPATTDEAGRNATLGKYFDFGGWSLSSSGYNFLHTKVSNGDKCNGQPGQLQWAVAKFKQGSDPKKPQNFVVHSGDPASYKLYNNDVVLVAFLPKGKSISSLGNPPSLPNLPGAAGNEGSTAPTTSPLSVPSGGPTTLPTATTPATTAAASPTSKP
jgi:hypothetical protein